MAFVLDNFDLLTGSRNNKSINSFQYKSTDASTAFVVAGYFNSIRTRLGIGDIITAHGSNDNKTIQLQVTALTPDVTVTDISHGSADGDVKGPGMSVNNEIPVFNGVTGKIIKQSGLLVDVTTPTFFNQAVLFMNEGGTGITVDPDGFFAYDRVNKAFVTGGGHNSSGVNSACVAGQSNNATALNSGCFAGANALISNTSIRAATLGGNQHQINGIDSVSIGGNNNNISSSDSSVMAGGGNNTITNGVINSIISSAASTITDSTNANIFGGTSQVISAGAHFANIFGGDGNFIGPNAANAIIIGGSTNAVRSPWGCAGGDSCDVSTTADNSFAYGEVIEIKGTHSVSFGRNNTHATGSNYSSTIGQFCNVDANYGHAKGHRAKSLHAGAFVYADSTNADFSSTVANSFNGRFTGGSYFDCPLVHYNNAASHGVGFVFSKKVGFPGGLIFDASLGVVGTALQNGEMEFVGQNGYVDWIWKDNTTGNDYHKIVYMARCFSATSGAPQQSIPNNVLTRVRFDTLETNHDPDFNTTTNAHTPTEPGVWHYVFDFGFVAPGGGNVVAMVHIYKNGAAVKSKNYNILTGEFGSPPSLTFITDMDGNLDSVECRVQFIGNGGGALLINNGPTGCTFSGNRIGDI